MTFTGHHPSLSWPLIHGAFCKAFTIPITRDGIFECLSVFNSRHHCAVRRFVYVLLRHLMFLEDYNGFIFSFSYEWFFFPRCYFFRCTVPFFFPSACKYLSWTILLFPSQCVCECKVYKRNICDSKERVGVTSTRLVLRFAFIFILNLSKVKYFFTPMYGNS